MKVMSRKEQTTLSGGIAESIPSVKGGKTWKVVWDFTVEWYLYFIPLAVMFEGIEPQGPRLGKCATEILTQPRGFEVF